jgi:hypothetical protein
MSLSSVLDQVRQRTGTQDLFTRVGITAFQSAVRTDLGNISSQWNTALKPLLDAIAEPSGVDALVKGLAGNTLWSNVDATAGSNSVFYSTALSRKLTIKESLEVLATQISSITKQGIAALSLVPYASNITGGFSTATNAQQLTNLLTLGSGVFELTTYPDTVGVLYLNSSTQLWAAAQADAVSKGAAALKAVQQETSDGLKYMLRQGRAVFASSRWDVVPTTVGQIIYLSAANAGKFTSTAPSASTNVVQTLGWVTGISGSDISVYLDLNQIYSVVP